MGKLTARLEKKAESESDAEIASPECPRPNPYTQSLPLPLFTVRTPTATVTDLGTEFGVEVSKDGYTMSHVFRGSVKLQF